MLQELLLSTPFYAMGNWGRKRVCMKGLGSLIYKWSTLLVTRLRWLSLLFALVWEKTVAGCPIKHTSFQRKKRICPSLPIPKCEDSSLNCKDKILIIVGKYRDIKHSSLSCRCEMYFSQSSLGVIWSLVNICFVSENVEASFVFPHRHTPVRITDWGGSH